MLRSARSVVRQTAKIAGGSVILGTAGVGLYASTDQGQGLRREIKFWSRVAPVVFDYYWNFAQSSPYVKYERFVRTRNAASEHDEGNDETKEKLDTRQDDEIALRRERLDDLNKRHAKDILEVFIELKGLYVKLGQVLSVTTLPIPEAYREQFRTLQSDVPGWEEFEEKVKPVVEAELGRALEEVFESFDPVPCGAASIGQAHKAILLASSNKKDRATAAGEEVIVKVQYPDAAWQIPADIQCVSDLLKICVFFGVVDESAANLSFNEFSRQFLSELDYDQERQNLEEIYQSSLDPKAPYKRRGVIVPKVYPELCTSKIITMSYLPGPKLEEEARRQLQALGIDTRMRINSIVRAPADNNKRNDKSKEESFDPAGVSKVGSPSRLDEEPKQKSFLWRLVGQGSASLFSNFVNIDILLSIIRLSRRVQLWGTAAIVSGIQGASSLKLTSALVPATVQSWAENHSTALQQARRIDLTKQWVEALFDVHAHQIFNLGCFNADAHPGNILVVGENTKQPKLGLIDFGQCKRLTLEEQVQVGKLLVSVANNESDERIATAFRELGIQTKNDNTEFLAKFAKLMFGPLQSYHLKHSWHKELHKQDAVTYFPSQLSMVYRTSMLLRGLAMSLQMNVSVGEQWKFHAQEAIDRAGAITTSNLTKDLEDTIPDKDSGNTVRRHTTAHLVFEGSQRDNYLSQSKV